MRAAHVNEIVVQLDSPFACSASRLESSAISRERVSRERALEVSHPGLPNRDRALQVLQFLFASDDAGVPGFAASDPHPVAAEPDAVPGR